MSLQSGAKFGRYEIVSKLGEGGMGEVYLAWDTQLDRQVAWSPDSKKLAGVKHLPNGVHSESEFMTSIWEAMTGSRISEIGRCG